MEIKQPLFIYIGLAFIISAMGFLPLVASAQSTPVITWNPIPVTYPCQLSGTQLNATANVPGTFTYSPSLGANLNAGNYTLNCTFTPNDTVNYTTASSSVNFTVNKYNSIITWNANPINFTYGYPLNPGQLSASGGAASGAFTFYYNGTRITYGQILPAGLDTITCSLIPYDTVDFTNNSTQKVFTVSKAIPHITWNQSANITYPTALNNTQLNATCPIAGSFSYSPSIGAVLHAGTNILNVTFTPNDISNYTTSTASVNLTVNKYNSIITWNANPINFTYGYPLNPGQLSASGGAASGAFTFYYNGTRITYGQILPVGADTIICSLIPYDTVDFTNNSTQKIFTVSEATPVITWNNSSMLYSTPLSNVQLNATCPIAGSFSYNPALGTVLPLGVNMLNVTFNPTDNANYSSVTKNISITVYQASPTSDFSANVVTGIVPLPIYFTDNSTGFNNTYQWDFGDGSPNSTDKNPIHVYPFGNNQYDVTETVTNSGGITTIQKINYIYTLDPVPVVVFYANITNGTYPQTIQFIDPPIGENITGYNWSFGDGSYSDLEDPTHSYASGTYTVIENVTNNGGTGTLTKINYINIEQSTSVINWDTPEDIVYGTPLNDIQLDATSDVDGTFVYTPSAGTILDVGTQTLHVDFTPDDIDNYTTASKDVTINVNPAPILPIANFAANKTSGYVPLTIKFTDSSQYATSWDWNFGDGTANSTEQSPVHKFTTAGSRRVVLTAINNNGTNSRSRTITVMAGAPIRPVASFISNVTSGTVPFGVQFTDTSINTPTSWAWNFGDGTTSTERNPIHLYTTGGDYTVAFTATNSAGSNNAISRIITANEEPSSITFYQKQSRPSDTLDNLDVNTSGVTSSRTSSAFGNITSSIANYLSFGTILIIIIGAYLVLQYLGIM